MSAPAHILPAFVAAVLLAGCAGGLGGARPDWVDGAPATRPDADWVTAAASGSDIDSARANARAELSRIFHSRVESTVSDETQFTNAGGTATVIEKLAIDTKVSTEGSFEGVRIAETWEDSSGTWHALAVLEKADMRRSLQVELEGTAKRAHGHLVQSDRAPTSLGRSKALIAALQASRERDAIVARARVVGWPVVRNLPSTADIARDLDGALTNTRFQVRAVELNAGTGAVRGELPKLREQLEKRITGIGFKSTGQGQGAPNVWLTCRMSLDEVPRGFEGYFFRWEGACEVTGAPPNGPVVLASQGSGGESYATKSIARTRALAKGSQKLAGDLEAQISRYLREGVDH